MGRYHFANLTTAVADHDSPLRNYLHERFPNTRALQAEYRERCGPLLVAGGGADPATVGAAFDVLTRFVLDDGYVPRFAALAFHGKPHLLRPIGEVARAAQEAAGRGDIDRLARASWALALCTAVYRQGMLPDSALASLIEAGRFTSPVLMSLASADALRQLRDLHSVASEKFVPAISPIRRLDLGPTFEASLLCPADADLIVDGTLLDIKTRLGTVVPRTGARRDVFKATDIYQVLAYTLFDRSDTYAITAIGIYSARYGLFVTWPLDDVLATLAGEPVDLRRAREQVWRLLGARG